MADVFISYAREDQERAAAVASALASTGLSVWWDRKVIAGETFDEVIERELNAAKCVLVLWSHSSIQSEWVKNEAAAAAERKVLVPAMLDEVPLPLEFRRRQTVSLVGWKSDRSHAGFRLLCEAIAARIERPTAAPPLSAMPHPPAPRPVRKSLWLAGAIVLLVTAVAIGAWMLWSNGTTASAPRTPTTVTERRPPPAVNQDGGRESSNAQPTAARPAPRPSTTVDEKPTRVPSWQSLAGRWNVTQVHDDGTTYHGVLVLSAAATVAPDGILSWRDRPSGRITGGSLRGNRLQLTLRYRDGAEGTYEGVVDDSQRRISEGSFVGQRGAPARWSAVRWTTRDGSVSR